MLLEQKKITLGFADLRTVASIGVLPEELSAPQEILISLEVDLEVSSCFQTDSLEDTIDYTALMRACKEVAALRHYNLLETLAWHILHFIGEEFPITRAQITITKPSASSSYVRMEQVYL